MALGSLLGGAGQFLGGVGSLGTSLVGESQEGTTAKAGTTSLTGSQTEQLQLDEAGLQKIIQDVLGGAEGLASIFQGQKTAGIFDSSVSAQAAGDLASKLVGEIAKITGKKVTTADELQEVNELTETTAGSAGILGQLGLSPKLTSSASVKNLTSNVFG